MNKKLIEFNNNLKNKKVAILGLGVSNIPLLDYLLDKECSVTVFNDKKIELDITKYPYTFYEDNESLKYLTNFDIIFRSPSFLPTREELAKEIKRGAYVTTEVTEVLKLCPCKVIGVTGSDGKTTTTTLIDLLLRENGYKTFLGGNIGTPLFTKINEMTENDIVVLELSSFQLMDMDVSPDISIITNITPNHLDKHKDLDEYIETFLKQINSDDKYLWAVDLIRMKFSKLIEYFYLRHMNFIKYFKILSRTSLDTLLTAFIYSGASFPPHSFSTCFSCSFSHSCNFVCN